MEAVTLRSILMQNVAFTAANAHIQYGVKNGSKLMDAIISVPRTHGAFLGYLEAVLPIRV